jgi:flavin reductase (DIM6/NTAB) family NADH-FMN oxidoreductase RutF
MSLVVPEETAPADGRVDQRHYRRVVSRFATGVTVVTANSAGVQFAMTANSFTSVSLDPMLVLFCVEKTARFHDVVLTARRWGVSVLGDGQEPASRWFATRGRPDAGQLARFPWTPGRHTEAALFDAAIATLECSTYAVHDGGDHTIIVGEVLDAGARPGLATPLVFYESRYRALPPN